MASNVREGDHKIRTYIKLGQQMNELSNSPEVAELFKTYSDLNQKRIIQRCITLLLKDDSEYVQNYINNTPELKSHYDKMNQSLAQVPSVKIAESFNDAEVVGSIVDVLRELQSLLKDDEFRYLISTTEDIYQKKGVSHHNNELDEFVRHVSENSIESERASNTTTRKHSLNRSRKTMKKMVPLRGRSRTRRKSH